MAKLDETFDTMFDELILAIEKQRELHTSAFGKENAQEIIAKAEVARQKLDCWWGLLQELKCEMLESGLFRGNGKLKKERGETRVRPKQPASGKTKQTGKKPVAVTVLGRRFAVNYWKEVLLSVCNLLFEIKPSLFIDIGKEELFQGRSGPYLTKDRSVLRRPAPIEGSGLYIETNFNADSIVRLCNTLLEFCGYSSADIKIEM